MYWLSNWVISLFLERMLNPNGILKTKSLLYMSWARLSHTYFGFLCRCQTGLTPRSLARKLTLLSLMKSGSLRSSRHAFPHVEAHWLRSGAGHQPHPPQFPSLTRSVRFSPQPLPETASRQPLFQMATLTESQTVSFSPSPLHRRVMGLGHSYASIRLYVSSSLLFQMLVRSLYNFLDQSIRRMFCSILKTEALLYKGSD